MDLIKVMRPCKVNKYNACRSSEKSRRKTCRHERVILLCSNVAFFQTPYSKGALKDTEDTIALDLNHIQEIKLVYQGIEASVKV